MSFLFHHIKQDIVSITANCVCINDKLFLDKYLKMNQRVSQRFQGIIFYFLNLFIVKSLCVFEDMTLSNQQKMPCPLQHNTKVIQFLYNS